MIDWFTVLAQVVNFLILLALLRYFLYHRILAAIEHRQQQIAANWEEARQKRQEAAQELTAARDQNRQLHEQRAALLAKAHQEVEQERQQLTAQVRTEITSLRERWSKSVQEEKTSFLRDLHRRAAVGVCSISRRALADLANVDLEGQIVARFMDQVDRLADDERTKIISSLSHGSPVAVVQTTFPLATKQQQSLENSVHAQFLDDVQLRFECTPDPICGIELHTDSHHLAWSVGDYLSSLEHELRQVLDEASTDGRKRHAAGSGEEQA